MSSRLIIPALGIALLATPVDARAGQPGMGESLNRLAAERDVVILFPPDLVANRPGRTAPRFVSTRRALELLLAGASVQVRSTISAGGALFLDPG